MKKTLLTLLLVSVSGSTLANGFYVGAAYSQLGHGKVSYSEQVSSDNGFAASAEYDLDLGSVFTLAAELEYKDLGGVVERELLGMGSYAQVDLSATSIGINVIPKFYINDNLYILGKMGLHNVSYTAKITSNVTNQFDRIIEESAVELGFGGGLGYHFGPLTAQLSLRIKKYC
ncbi:outer membrane beta-barrel protein [Vibrio splendidus]